MGILIGRTENLTAVENLIGNCGDAQSFIDRMTELGKDRKQETKDLLKAAGGYRRLFAYADRMYNPEGACTTAVVEKWFINSVDTPALAMCDPGGYRYTIRGRFDPKYGFRYLSEFMAVYGWYLESMNIRAARRHETEAE